jgi:hypothetical protein
LLPTRRILAARYECRDIVEDDDLDDKKATDSAGWKAKGAYVVKVAIPVSVG